MTVFGDYYDGSLRELPSKLFLCCCPATTVPSPPEFPLCTLLKIAAESTCATPYALNLVKVEELSDLIWVRTRSEQLDPVFLESPPPAILDFYLSERVID
jgi:hypothetical protein